MASDQRPHAGDVSSEAAEDRPSRRELEQLEVVSGRLAYGPAKDRSVETDEHSGAAALDDLDSQILVRGSRAVGGSCQQLRL